MRDNIPVLPVTALSHYVALGACDHYLMRAAARATRDGHWCDDTGWAKKLGDETEKMFADQCGHVGIRLEEAEEVVASGGRGVAKQVELKGELAGCGKTLPATLHLVTPAKAGVHAGASCGI